jgi:hypothetical protein
MDYFLLETPSLGFKLMSTPGFPCFPGHLFSISSAGFSFCSQASLFMSLLHTDVDN